MLFNIHTHFYSSVSNITSFQSIDISENSSMPDVGLFSAGIHPWHADLTKLNENLDFLEKISGLPNFIAVGECGYDKLKGPSFEIQDKVFEAQALLAKELKKPVIIHNVKYYDELLQMHEKIKPSEPWIIHGFRKNVQLALQLIEKGFLFSFGIAILQDKKLDEVLKKINSEFIFLETDDQDSTLILELYKKVANLKNMKMSELEKCLEDNIARVFKVS